MALIAIITSVILFIFLLWMGCPWYACLLVCFVGLSGFGGYVYKPSSNRDKWEWDEWDHDEEDWIDEHKH